MAYGVETTNSYQKVGQLAINYVCNMYKLTQLHCTCDCQIQTFNTNMCNKMAYNTNSLCKKLQSIL